MANDTYCIVIYLKAISIISELKEYYERWYINWHITSSKYTIQIYPTSAYRGSLLKISLYIRIEIIDIESHAC